MAIIRWRPLGEIDKFFEELGALAQGSRDLAADVYEDNGNVIVEVQLAGVNPDKVDINVEGDHVRITGSREEEHEKKERNYYVREIRRGTFERIIHLPVPVNAEQTRAEVDNGILKITLPKLSQAQPRKIKVKSKAEGVKAEGTKARSRTAATKA